MGRAKKDSKPFSIRMAQSVYDDLCRYCVETGVPKTTLIERAVSCYIKEYDREKKIVEAFNGK